MNNSSVGILLLQMGGPDRLEDVPAFLYNLFSDREIIKLGPAFLQKPLARLISSRRAPKSQEIYRKIGGGSPLKRITERQARTLEALLRRQGEFHVEVAMRYWPPLAEQAIHALLAQGVEQMIALPLYPHYTRATSGSSLTDLRRAHARIAPNVPLLEIPSWPEQEHYVRALADRIVRGAKRFEGEPMTLVYSAHSLPISFIEDGDPYVEEITRTIRAVEAITGIAGTLCYQSRSGPVRWMRPVTEETIRALAEKGTRALLVVPVSFVSDHIETLHEIDIEYRELAQNCGIPWFQRAPSLNDHGDFLWAMASLVRSRLPQRWTHNGAPSSDGAP